VHGSAAYNAGVRILVTNDDGIHAPGIELLARAASRFGDVWVVAPDTERSGVSHAITLFRPLRLRNAGDQRFACDGTPTDCVYLALHQLGLRPDLLLSGVNPGPNLAHDVLYSGTVAGALEGAHWKVPSVALSHCASSEDALAGLEDVLPDVLEAVVPMARQTPHALNVNLPSIANGRYRGIRVARLGQRYYSNEVHERHDPRGRHYFWIGGADVHMPDIVGSDCNAIRDGYVSVTPLNDDMTRDSALAGLEDGLAAWADRPIGEERGEQEAGS
jgi:5'-nucleotidase